MIARVLSVLVLLIAMSDVSLTGPVNYAALFQKGAAMALEQPERAVTGANLMNSGDYSGCTLEMIVSEAPGWNSSERVSVVLPSQGMEWAILYVGKSITRQVLRR